jgi:hypothetical protein
MIAETVSAGQSLFFTFQNAEILLCDLQLMLGFFLFGHQLLKRLFLCHGITPFLCPGKTKAPDFLRSRAYSNSQYLSHL